MLLLILLLLLHFIKNKCVFLLNSVSADWGLHGDVSVFGAVLSQFDILLYSALRKFSIFSAAKLATQTGSKVYKSLG